MQEYIQYVREDVDLEDNGLPMEAPVAGSLHVRAAREEPCGGEPYASLEQRAGAGGQVAAPPQIAGSVQPAGGNGSKPPAAVAPAVSLAPAAGPVCQALTKSGRPCRNRPLPGKTTCRLHTQA